MFAAEQPFCGIPEPWPQVAANEYRRLNEPRRAAIQRKWS
jgi:hypothetical protein